MDSSTATLSEADTDLLNAIQGGIHPDRLSTGVKLEVLRHAIGVLTKMGGKSPGFRPLSGRYPETGSFSPYVDLLYPAGLGETTKVNQIFRMESVEIGGFKKGKRAPHKYVRKHHAQDDVRWVTHDHYLVTQDGLMLRESQTIYLRRVGDEQENICAAVDMTVMDDAAILAFLELPYTSDFGVLSSCLKSIRISIRASIAESRDRLASLEAMHAQIDAVWHRAGGPTGSLPRY